MLPGSITIDFAGETFSLLPDRAAYWPARQTLLVADVHLGKGNTFRKAGVPVPAGSSAKDLGRLSALLDVTAAQRLVILGDLVHARCSHDPLLADSVSRWRTQHAAIEMLLIRGNHDRSAGPLPAEWDIAEVEEPHVQGPLTFSHAPRDDEANPVLAGHVHPVVALRDFDGSAVRIPCFVFGDRCAILPAFGSFTGGHSVTPANQRLYLATATRVTRV